MAVVNQAKADRAAAVNSKIAMQVFVANLWNYWYHMLSASTFPRNNVATGNLKSGIVKLFRQHMPIMASMRYSPSPAELNKVVDSLLMPVDWNEVYRIVDSATTSVFEVITNTSHIADSAADWQGQCEARHREASRLSHHFRRSCRMCSGILDRESTVADEAV